MSFLVTSILGEKAVAMACGSKTGQTLFCLANVHMQPSCVPPSSFLWVVITKTNKNLALGHLAILTLYLSKKLGKASKGKQAKI